MIDTTDCVQRSSYQTTTTATCIRSMKSIFTAGIAFSLPQEFKLVATTEDDNDIRTYVSDRFVAKMIHWVEEILLDLVTPIPLRTVSVRLARKVCVAHLRNICKHMLCCMAGDGSSHGGLQRLGDFIALPFSPPLPTEVAITGKKRGHSSESGTTSIDTLSLDKSFDRIARRNLGPSGERIGQSSR